MSVHPRDCSIARTLDVVGEKWSLLVLREVFLGNRRFEAILARTGAPRDTIAARLRTLVEGDVLERRRYQDHPPRSEYVLTAAGRDLLPALLALLRWGDVHRAGTDGPPMTLQHRHDHPLRTETVCADCGDPVRFEQVSPTRQ